ncbi:hypothetical protein [Treponema sp. R80B11-R83G3]
MIFGEYDRDMDIAVNRREASEETRKEDCQYFYELLDQGLTTDEIKQRLNQFTGAQSCTAQPCG